MITERVFKDPTGKFLIIIPKGWQYNKDAKTVKRGLHQFEVSEGCVFQISCRPINPDISKIIKANRIDPHDFDLPNISYHEKYQEQQGIHSYNWMSQIEDHFILSTYFYNPHKKDRTEIAIDLMNARLTLQRLQFNHKTEAPSLAKDQEKDYTDIESWRNHPSMFFDFITNSNKSSVQRISPLSIDTVKLFALLKTKISYKPNGFYDLVRIGLPLDNMIWWDFILECDKGFIQVWRTPYVIEALYRFEGELNLQSFFEENIQKYNVEISNTISSLDRHTLYINHFKSYDECVKYLWEEINEIDLTEPEGPVSHVSEDSEDLKDYFREVSTYAENYVKYHVLAKSLVLNAAFKVESFLNLVIRVGVKSELKLYSDILNRFLRQDFSFRVKNLRYYSRILTADIDIRNSVYRESKELMNLRNKYVHFDEDSLYNKIGEVYYDEDCPLLQTEDSRPAIESIKQMYYRPEIEVVRKAKETSDNFVEYLKGLLIPEIKDNLIFLFDQNPIGYNESSGVYSSVLNPKSIDFFTSVKKEMKKKSK